MKKLLLCVLMSLTTSVFASGFYAGGQVGMAKDGLDASNNVVKTDTIKKSEDPLAARIFFGYGFNKYFALETGYLFTSKESISDIVYSQKIASHEAREQIADVDLKGSWYMGDKFFVYGKAGLAYINVKVDGDKGSNVNVLYGTGIGYDFDDHTSVDVSWTRYNGSKSSAFDFINHRWHPSMDVYGLSLTYKF